LLAGRRVLLIIGGGIAAYKSLELIRLLRKAGAAVAPVLTAGGAVADLLRDGRRLAVHVVELEGGSWRASLAFRDALRADESLRAEYLRMKEHAVALAPAGRARYNELKHSFIERSARGR
jgi:hypothetical protein